MILSPNHWEYLKLSIAPLMPTFQTMLSLLLKKRLFSFLWKSKKDKLKLRQNYQNYDKGGLRMPDLECMIKALRMAWIPRLLKEGHQNWKTLPDHFFKRYGGLEFILSCIYNVKFFENLPNFYKDIVLYFSELQTLYNHDNV